MVPSSGVVESGAQPRRWLEHTCWRVSRRRHDVFGVADLSIMPRSLVSRRLSDDHCVWELNGFELKF